MRGSHQAERQCEECAEPLRKGELAELCREVMQRAQLPAAAASKLLPRLFRAVARELRVRGWDPIELLMSMPDEPASESDTAPGGIQGKPPTRRRWLFPPEVELEKLDALIDARLQRGESVGWHVERREQIAEFLAVRAANSASARAT